MHSRIGILLVFLSGIGLGLSSLGCCHPGKTQVVSRASARNAIFNPEYSPAPLEDFDRSDWPVAYAGDSSAEEIAYREHFIDIHSRGSGRDDGFLLRRFEFDRVGRTRR